MEYCILWHEGAKPHFIISGYVKELVKKDLINRGYKFLNETTFTTSNQTSNILLDFGIKNAVCSNLCNISKTPFKYYSLEFDELRKAINSTINKGDRGGYCKLVSSDYAFCLSSELLFTIRDYLIKEERLLGDIKPYEENDEGTELRW